MSKQKIKKLRPSKKELSFDDRVMESIETICENVEVTRTLAKPHYYQYIPADIAAAVIDVVTDAEGCGYRAEMTEEGVMYKKILCNKYKIFV